MDLTQSSKPDLINPIRVFASFLLNFELWAAVGLAAASFASTRFLPWAVIGVFAFWPIRWVARGRLTDRSPADWGIALVALMAPVTLWATALPETTNPQVYRLLFGIGLFYTFLNWGSSEPRLKWILAGTAGMLIVISGLSLVGVEWATGKLPFIPNVLYQRFPLLLADTIHPNVLGGSLVIILPLVMAAVLFAGKDLRWYAHLFLAFASVIGILMLVLTKSRGAWMAFGAVLALLVLLRWRWGWVGLVLASGAAGGVTYHYGIPLIVETITASNTLGGIEGRIEVWSRAIYMIQDFPFTGIGMGTFGPVADLLYPFFLAAPGKMPHAHNLFLQIAVDLGIPGFLGWLSTWMLVTFSAWKIYRRGKRAHQGLAAGIGAGILCSQLALVVHGMFDAVTWGMVRPAPVVWVLWGAAMAAGAVWGKEPAET